MFIKSNMENNYNYNYTHISLVWSIMWAIMDLESRKSFPHTKHLYRLSIQSLHCLVTVSALSYCLPQTVHSNGFFMPKCSLTMCTARLFAFAKHFWHCLHLCLPRLMVLCSWRVLGHAEALTPADYTHTHTHNTQPFYGSVDCLGQPGWAGTRRCILPSSGFSGAKWR